VKNALPISKPGREKFEKFALVYLAKPFDIFIGGGMDYFVHRKNDTRNLVTELTSKGYEISTIFDEDINALDITTSKKIGDFPGNAEPLQMLSRWGFGFAATNTRICFSG